MSGPTSRTTSSARGRGTGPQNLGVVNSFTPYQVPGSTGGDYGDIAVGPAGQVLVTYETGVSGGSDLAGPGDIWVNLDADGLGSGGFGGAVLATSTNVGTLRSIPAQAPAIDAEPRLAWDRSGGPFNGRLYLVYTDAADTTTSATDIYIRTSTDAGTTWAAPVLVNDDPNECPGQFDPTIALDQTTGDFAVGWYGSSRKRPESHRRRWPRTASCASSTPRSVGMAGRHSRRIPCSADGPSDSNDASLQRPAASRVAATSATAITRGRRSSEASSFPSGRTTTSCQSVPSAASY